MGIFLLEKPVVKHLPIYQCTVIFKVVLISVLHKWIHNAIWAQPEVLSKTEPYTEFSRTFTQLLMDVQSSSSTLLTTTSVTLPRALRVTSTTV